MRMRNKRQSEILGNEDNSEHWEEIYKFKVLGKTFVDEEEDSEHLTTDRLEW